MATPKDKRRRLQSLGQLPPRQRPRRDSAAPSIKAEVEDGPPSATGASASGGPKEEASSASSASSASDEDQEQGEEEEDDEDEEGGRGEGRGRKRRRELTDDGRSVAAQAFTPEGIGPLVEAAGTVKMKRHLELEELRREARAYRATERAAMAARAPVPLPRARGARHDSLATFALLRPRRGRWYVGAPLFFCVPCDRVCDRGVRASFDSCCSCVCTGGRWTRRGPTSSCPRRSSWRSTRRAGKEPPSLSARALPRTYSRRCCAGKGAVVQR